LAYTTSPGNTARQGSGPCLSLRQYRRRPRSRSSVCRFSRQPCASFRDIKEQVPDDENVCTNLANDRNGGDQPGTRSRGSFRCIDAHSVIHAPGYQKKGTGRDCSHALLAPSRFVVRISERNEPPVKPETVSRRSSAGKITG